MFEYQNLNQTQCCKPFHFWSVLNVFLSSMGSNIWDSWHSSLLFKYKNVICYFVKGQGYLHHIEWPGSSSSTGTAAATTTTTTTVCVCVCVCVCVVCVCVCVCACVRVCECLKLFMTYCKINCFFSLVGHLSINMYCTRIHDHCTSVIYHTA